MSKPGYTVKIFGRYCPECKRACDAEFCASDHPTTLCVDLPLSEFVEFDGMDVSWASEEVSGSGYARQHSEGGTIIGITDEASVWFDNEEAEIEEGLKELTEGDDK